jgi:hypothetical protein
VKAFEQTLWNIAANIGKKLKPEQLIAAGLLLNSQRHFTFM